MRIIAGFLKGRQLLTLKGVQTRPTADRVREALFNILGERVVGATFLDLFAGSGAVGIEALSRGAEKVLLVEKAPAAVKIINANLTRCQLLSQVEVITAGVCQILPRLLAKRRFDIIFLDPPYSSRLAEKTVSIISRQPEIETTLIVVEHYYQQELKSIKENCRQYRYGETCLCFLTLQRQL